MMSHDLVVKMTPLSHTSSHISEPCTKMTPQAYNLLPYIAFPQCLSMCAMITIISYVNMQSLASFAGTDWHLCAAVWLQSIIKYAKYRWHVWHVLSLITDWTDRQYRSYGHHSIYIYRV